MNQHIIVMSKFPRLGEVNTRMIPDIGAEKATAVHRKMAEHSIQKAASFNPDTRCVVHIANATLSEAEQWLGLEMRARYILQNGNDLGARMANAIQASTAHGAEKILVIGTDCPELVAENFQQAFDALDQHDVVYIPAHDGGYVLIGMKKTQCAAFTKIDWGTSSVMQQSLEQLDQAGISYFLLDQMADVDFANDIPVSFLND